ncbi:NADH dehydrogenase [ubiquinone] 1 alpha subcomplex subunit 10, mitochondrial [Schistocerca piceifrons]|uniref:NADH dehydrogenase [ubiquinone] 1 alpha subcomplex subunit 10, mitochondrial n=1 Tax=Schistocerca piceifrons TaxID=274613 RepID=UPI001F5E8A91|nr:NADH dehydrogenase [ubiquinone] 1 alpha subcomplex subunit 10, mitochondrial [Schistocerca piceifrons]
MALACVKVTLGRVLGSKPLICGRATPNVGGLFQVQVCGISGKALRDKNYKRPAPWPYKERGYNVFWSWIDKTRHRFDDNSKIVVVEGPPAAGKTAFASALATDLDMLHLPEVTMDMHYINPYGYDMRQLDPQMPDSLKSYDHRDFCRNPTHRNAATFQMLMYRYRFSQYVDALAHLMNTGQGVVLERCAFSDFVFVEAMVQCGYLSKTARSVYYDVRRNTISELLEPHLVIYLDVPPAAVRQKVEARKLPHERNSPVYKGDFLEHLEEAYKQRFLQEISNHAQLLVYDWSEGGDVEVVVEDIERVDMDQSDKHDPKFHDWKELAAEWEWTEARTLYTNQKDDLMCFFNVPRFDCPELNVDPYDAKKYEELWDNAPGMKYRKGFNQDMGDRGILVKTKAV